MTEINRINYYFHSFSRGQSEVKRKKKKNKGKIFVTGFIG